MAEIRGQETEIVRPIHSGGDIRGTRYRRRDDRPRSHFDRLSVRYVVERSLEELPPPGRSYVRDNDDQPGVQRSPVVESEKIGSVIGHECVVVFENERHQFPVFKASEAQVIDVIGDKTRGACEVNKGQMQAFIN